MSTESQLARVGFVALTLCAAGVLVIWGQYPGPLEEGAEDRRGVSEVQQRRSLERSPPKGDDGTEMEPPNEGVRAEGAAASPQPTDLDDGDTMRSISGTSYLKSGGERGNVLVEGCGSNAWSGPTGLWEMWVPSDGCRVRAVHFNGGAAAEGRWHRVAPGGDLSGLQVEVPPRPAWEPVVERSERELLEEEERIARFEALLLEFDGEEEQREIREVLDQLYERAGLEERIAPASVEELDRWRQGRKNGE